MKSSSSLRSFKGAFKQEANTKRALYHCKSEKNHSAL
jgi:hypothetical protein